MQTRLSVLAAAILLSGCSTHIDLLEMRRDQLLRLEASANEVNTRAARGDFRPQNYDLYLLLNKTLFDQTLGGFSGSTASIELQERTVDITLTKVAMAFRPGGSEVTVDAIAKDRKSGLEAELYMDVRLVLEGDPAKPSEMYLRLLPTKIVPRVAWGPFDFTRQRFVRDLLTLEAMKFSERLPRMTLPIQNAFAVGSPGGTVPIGPIPVGGARMWGNVTYPGTQVSGAVTVKQILFLGNGVHLFANVEGV